MAERRCRGFVSQFQRHLPGRRRTQRPRIGCALALVHHCLLLAAVQEHDSREDLHRCREERQVPVGHRELRRGPLWDVRQTKLYSRIDRKTNGTLPRDVK